MSRPSPFVSAVVLAAGRSSRMGAANKLLLRASEGPLVARVVDAVRRAGPGEIIVVTGHEADRVRAAVEVGAVRVVHNPDHRSGMAASVRAGVKAARPGASGFLICLGDMPDVRPATMRRMMQVHAQAPVGAIVVVEREGRRGNPVLFHARYRNELLELSGDRGARGLIDRHAGQVVALTVDDPGVLVDLDTEEAYRRWAAAESNERDASEETDGPDQSGG